MFVLVLKVLLKNLILITFIGLAIYQGKELVKTAYENNFANFYLFSENQRLIQIAENKRINLTEMCKMSASFDTIFRDFTNQKISNLVYYYKPKFYIDSIINHHFAVFRNPNTILTNKVVSAYLMSMDSIQNLFHPEDIENQSVVFLFPLDKLQDDTMYYKLKFINTISDINLHAINGHDTLFHEDLKCLDKKKQYKYEYVSPISKSKRQYTEEFVDNSLFTNE